MNLILIYLVSLIFIYSIFFITDLTSNIFIKIIVPSIPILFILLLIGTRKIDISAPKIDNEDYFIRYDMLCHKCNWEWMSNSAKKAPSQCPKCNNNQKNMLEVIGWRKLNIHTAKDKDLRNFIKA